MISPELALVDPELAALGRRLLERSELESARVVPAPPRLAPRVEPAPIPSAHLPAPSRRRQRARRIAVRGLTGLTAAVGLGAVLATITHAGYGGLPGWTRVAAPDPVPSARAVQDDTVRTGRAARSSTATPKRSSTAGAQERPIGRRTFVAPAIDQVTADRSTGDSAASATTRPKTSVTRGAKEHVTSPASPKPVPTTEGRSQPVLHWRSSPKTAFFDVVLWRDGHRLLDSWPTEGTLRIPSSWSYRGHAYRLDPGSYLWFVYPGIGPRSAGRYGPLLASGRFTITASART